MHQGFTPVTSSNIDGYHYMADRQLLLIAFKSGGTYSYENVEQPIVDGFATASSKGAFFQSRIRDNYATTSLDDMAVANLMGGLGVSISNAARRKTNAVTLQSLLLRYPALNAVF